MENGLEVLVKDFSLHHPAHSAEVVLALGAVVEVRVLLKIGVSTLVTPRTAVVSVGLSTLKSHHVVITALDLEIRLVHSILLL